MYKKNIMVSIIVPVYNVEKYLDRCVRSLVNQTYKNIEILLVDDGSTDSSGDMCEDYAKCFNNVIVLHKQNGGLSSARNFAIPYVSGEYVTFVDSDDYVELYYVEYMLDPIINDMSNDAIDMVICNNTNETQDGIIIGKKISSIDRHQISREYMTAQATLEAMCYIRKFGTSVGGKLIAATIAKDFHFLVGRIYEDLATVFRIIDASRQIVFLNVPMYHYVNRRGSIRHSAWTPATSDVMTAAQELLNYIDQNYPNIHDAGVYRFFISANEFYIRAFREDNYLEIINPVRDQLKDLLPEILHNRKILIIRKIQFFMLVHTPRLYRHLKQKYEMR